MAIAGNRVISSTGRHGVLSTGKDAVFNAAGQCSECCEGECPDDYWCEMFCFEDYYADVSPCWGGIFHMNRGGACDWASVGGHALIECYQGLWYLDLWAEDLRNLWCTWTKAAWWDCPDGIYTLVFELEPCCEDFIVVY